MSAIIAATVFCLNVVSHSLSAAETKRSPN